MSFASEVKDELKDQSTSSRHCQIAELAAIISFCGKIIRRKNGEMYLKIQTESALAARKCFTLLKKTFNICTDILLKSASGSRKTVYCLYIFDVEEFEKVFRAVKLELPIDDRAALICTKTCCKRAFVRGAFLSAGSISDPEHSYHFEIACDEPLLAESVKNTINSIDISEPIAAKITTRKKQSVVYVKEGSQIVDLLNLMGAHLSLMKLESLRVVKEMRNNVNRRVNCETANINKTVSASVKQIEDINFLKNNGGYNNLNPTLVEMAEVRLEYPEATLKELGEMLNPPVGKSGVNHRLRKLSVEAMKLRGDI